MIGLNMTSSNTLKIMSMKPTKIDELSIKNPKNIISKICNYEVLI